MDSDEFRRHGHALVDWIADYLETVGDVSRSNRYPVLSQIAPGDIIRALPDVAPEDPESFGAIMADFERVLVPGLTNWNHPGFFAYFAITASAPGILGEFLSAALNQQAMLWRTSPAATELEHVVLGWLRRMMGLPAEFEGVIYDTASISTMHALAAAREVAVPCVSEEGLSGRGLPTYRVYCSEHAHSSVDKAAMTIGIGRRSLRKITTDEAFQLDPAALSRAIAADRAEGVVPLAVVATIGTTSTTSVDPLAAIAEICTREHVWLHVDAAYAGVAAVLPSHRHILTGVDRADSLVVNPHKWLFTPFDLSAFFCRRMNVLRAAFSLTPEYLTTSEASEVRNLMDTGIQLGRRFRALKLWMVLRSFGARGIRELLERHMQLAREFARWVDDDPDFARVAPVPFSVVCFRWEPRALDAPDTPGLSAPDSGLNGPHTPGLNAPDTPGLNAPDSKLDSLNANLLDAVNRSGEVFLSHTRLNGRYVLRLAIGHERTTIDHVSRAWALLREHAARISAHQ